MKKLMIMIFMLLAAVLTASDKVHYYDEDIVLTGVVNSVLTGSEMEESEKDIQIYVLELASPLSIKEREPVFGDGEIETIYEVHLAESFDSAEDNLAKAVGKKVKVKGEIMKAHTIHHRRDAVLLDTEIVK